MTNVRLDHEEMRLALKFERLMERQTLALERLAPEPIEVEANIDELKFSYLLDEEMWQVEMTKRQQTLSWTIGPFKIRYLMGSYEVEGVNLGTDNSPFDEFKDANNRVAETILNNIQEEGEPW